MTAEAKITLPFDPEADRLARLRDSDAEPDPHKAFHLRSGLRLPDPDGLCVRCGATNG